jgi:hypothetical protein
LYDLSSLRYQNALKIYPGSTSIAIRLASCLYKYSLLPTTKPSEKLLFLQKVVNLLYVVLIKKKATQPTRKGRRPSINTVEQQRRKSIGDGNSRHHRGRSIGGNASRGVAGSGTGSGTSSGTGKRGTYDNNDKRGTYDNNDKRGTYDNNDKRGTYDNNDNNATAMYSVDNDGNGGNDGGGESGGTTVPPTMFTNSRRLGHMRRKSQVFNKFPQVWVEDRYSKCEALLDEVSVLIKNLSENGLRRKTRVEEEGSAEKGGREGHGNRSKLPDEQVETKHQDRRPAVPTNPGRTEEEDHRGHVGACFTWCHLLLGHT